MDYFTFEIDGQKVGYYEESDGGSEYYMNAFISMDGQLFENPFWIKYDGLKVSAYKYGDVDYIQFDQAEGVYPSSALMILARSLKDGEQLDYQSFHEGRGEVIGPAKLVREGNRITEMVAGKPGRYVVLKDGKPIEYGWGGTAKSSRVEDQEAAIKNTPFE